MSSHASSPGARAADSVAQAGGGMGLGQRTRIRIDLFLARRAGAGPATPKIQALREHGRAAGMNSAEIMANEEGGSHDARASACLAFVAALLAHPGPPSPEVLRRMHDAGYRPEAVDEVIARVRQKAPWRDGQRRTTGAVRR